MVAASAAIDPLGIPFMGPIGGARAVTSTASYVLNPTIEEIKTSELDLIVGRLAGRRVMVEFEAKDSARDYAARRRVRSQGLPAGAQGDHPPRRALRRQPRRFRSRCRRSPIRQGEADRRSECAVPMRSPEGDRQEAVAKVKDKVAGRGDRRRRCRCADAAKGCRSLEHLEKAGPQRYS